jgi:hypothetical protein
MGGRSRGSASWSADKETRRPVILYHSVPKPHAEYRQEDPVSIEYQSLVRAAGSATAATTPTTAINKEYAAST